MLAEERHPFPQPRVDQTLPIDLPWFLELEITGFCQLRCMHCYANSGPESDHGTMTADDWEHVIDEAKALCVDAVQFIGGEPTLHPGFTRLLEHAIGAGLKVEVYSNLAHIKDSWWELFAAPMVSLATSYYCDTPSGHDTVTGRRGSHARTRANIAEAVRRKIPLRVGIIEVLDGRRVGQARADLETLGVTDVGTDRLRGVGRAAPIIGTPGVSQLCGHCGRGRAAISPNGDVWPCVLSRWMNAGNVKESSLAEILYGPRMRELVAMIPSYDKGEKDPCNPDKGEKNPCGPDKTGCKPKNNGGDCQPAEKPACKPKFKPPKPR